MNPSLAHKLQIEIIYQEFNLLPALSAAENLFAGEQKGHSLWINKKAELAVVRQQIQNLRIATPSPAQLVKNLSGGNQ